MTVFAEIKAAAAWCQKADDAAVRDVGERLAGWDGLTVLHEHLELPRVPTRAERYAARDQILRQLVARHLPRGFSDLSTADKLATRMDRYFRQKWPETRSATTCPHDVFSVDGCFWQALRLVPRPLGERHLRRMLATFSK